MLKTRSLLGLLIAVLIAVPDPVQAQGGAPPTYPDIVITDMTYADGVSTYTLDTDGDTLGDTVVTDDGNHFLDAMTDEYAFQAFSTDIWVEGGKIYALNQYYIPT